MAGESRAECLQRFPMLANLDDEAGQRVLSSARHVTLRPGTRVFRHGDRCRNYLLLLSGTVRVQKSSESGREIMLYRLRPGQACVLTTSCLLAHERYPAEAIAESEVRAIVIAQERFQEGLARSDTFRKFVFAAYGQRIADLIVRVEEIAFQRIDVRLAGWLAERAAGACSIATTHQALAAELGTAREVVSRRLKGFERHGWVRLHRGRIELVAPDVLRQLAETG